MKKHLKKTALLLATAMSLSAPALADNQPLHYNIVEFNESATVKVPNDTMHITLVIEETHKNRETASNLVTQKLNTIQARLKSNKRLIAQIGSRYTYPQYGDKGKITGWQDRVSVSIKSTDFEALSKLAADMQEQAMIRGMSFSVSPEKRMKAVEQASEQALQALQHRAQFISRQLGFSSYKVVKVDLTDTFESRAEASMDYAVPQVARMSAKAAAPAMEVNSDHAGEQEIRQTVRVSVQMQ